MKIMVVGGDGFCGWPISLYLSKKGHEITIVDNFSRRKIDADLGVGSLTPIQPIQTRLQVWQELEQKQIHFKNLTVGSDYLELLMLIEESKPEVIIHLGEQRAAPYSMKSAKTKRYTVSNNLNATHDILSAIVDSELDIHLVHMGTMGVYGYDDSGMVTPEGYLDVYTKDGYKEVKRNILFPTQPGSIYHLTKSQDQLFFQFYNKNDGIRITDLHQGIVWGTQTPETMLDERLINRFDYDGDYGTVLNRFLMQAAVGFPLTVHGTGGQTRAFINIQDTCKCIDIAIQNPPKMGEKVKILNQMTETHTVLDLANLVADKCDADIQFVNNPRNESAENQLRVSNQQFIQHGLNPVLLSDVLLQEVNNTAKKYRDRCDKSKIPCESYWGRHLAS